MYHVLNAEEQELIRKGFWNKRLWISLPEIEIDKYTQSEKYRKIGEYIDECKDDRRIFVAK